jgi:hypothetical protein
MSFPTKATINNLKSEFSLRLRLKQSNDFYLNICSLPDVPPPIAPSGAPIDLRMGNLFNAKVPFDFGNVRNDSVDVVFSDQLFRIKNQFKADLTRIASSHSREMFLRFDQIEEVQDIPEYYGIFTGEFVPIENSVDAENISTIEKANTKSEVVISPSKSKSSVVKKGFLSNPKKSIYPESGSNEGNLPENAGDPLGWMPKNLRNKLLLVNGETEKFQKKGNESIENHSIEANFSVKDDKIVIKFDGVESSAATSLECSIDSVRLSQSSWTLPRRIDVDSVQAKFSKMKKQLTVECSIIT